MPLTVIRSDSNAALWRTCVSRFFGELGDRSSASEYPAHLWVAHRTQRDLLLEEAEARGLPGWLDPPIAFLSELPSRFEIDGRPLGHLAGRLLLARIAAERAHAHGFVEADGPGRSQMVDRTLSELLPEGVTPDRLDEALAALPQDEFTTRRNAWLCETFRTYLAHIEERDRYDPRSVHARIAEQVRSGGLSRAIGDAARLHVFGLTSLQGRRRLFEALAAQREVQVFVYVPAEVESGEWETLAGQIEEAPAAENPRVSVQPTPDAVREAAWVARSIKRLLLDGDAAPHEVAVIARSGREDTRRIREALRRAGVPSTARLRSRLAEIPALRAVLALFDAVSQGWSAATLRPVLKSPYFGVDLSLGSLDFLAGRARPEGISGWIDGLRTLREEARSDRGWVLSRAGITETRLGRDIRVLEALAEAVTELGEARAESEWIETTRRLLRGDPLGMRERVCAAVEDRWDVVRLDQRGSLALEGLLVEWKDLLPEREVEIEPREWHARLSRVLHANEIALSTPLQRGVQVLEAHEAALTPFKRTFIVHANDGVFPRSEMGGLFTESERARLSDLGMPLPTRELRLERERRLWMACAGSEEVWVTYWTADSSGVPRLPSLFVPSHQRDHELPRTRRELPQETDAPVTRAELLESEVMRFLARRRSENWDAFETPAAREIRHAALGAFADELRTGGLDVFAETGLSIQADAAGLRTSDDQAAARFANERPLSERATAWNGLVRDPVLLRVLEKRFPERGEWSASRLELYATRPFDFLVERVLGLTETAETEDEANRLTTGALVHAILERFYLGLEAAELSTGQFGPSSAERFEEIFDDVCAQYEGDEARWVGMPHVWAATREELRADVRRFLEWELSRPDACLPIAVELEFGQHTDLGSADFSGQGQDGASHILLLGGRIDRVDRVDVNGIERLRVVDYKSGRSAPSPQAFDDGAAMQAVLYMAAVEALGLGEAALGVYRTVRAPANRAKRGPADVAPVLELARQIPARIRSGRFEAVQAHSTEIRDWQHGKDITRTTARISSGTRFDLVARAALPGSGQRDPATGDAVSG